MKKTKYCEVSKFGKNNSFQWNTEVIPGRNADEYTMNYHHRSLFALWGAGRIVPSGVLYVRDDTMYIDWMCCVRHRTKTLAIGGNC